jgi:large conductance mechanosensitive channel
MPKARSAIAGFADFVRKQGVVGLAIGLAIGTQAAGLVNTIVSTLITPMVDLLIGQDGLKGVSLTLDIGSRSSTFQFGLLIDALLKFLAVAAVIYFVVIGLKLDKLDKKKDS